MKTFNRIEHSADPCGIMLENPTQHGQLPPAITLESTTQIVINLVNVLSYNRALFF